MTLYVADNNTPGDLYRKSQRALKERKPKTAGNTGVTRVTDSEPRQENAPEEPLSVP